MPIMTAILTLQMSGLPQIYAYSTAYADEVDPAVVIPADAPEEGVSEADDVPANEDEGQPAGGEENPGANTTDQDSPQPEVPAEQNDSYIRPGVLRVGDFIFDTTTNTIEKYVGTSAVVDVPGSLMVKGVAVSVKHIGKEAFRLEGASPKITSVTLPQGLETIGEYAFVANDIQSISIPASVVEIKEGAFAANKLTGPAGVQVPVDSKLTKIGKLAFDNNLLTSLNLSNATKLEEIGEAAFSQNKLTDVQFPPSLKKIGDRAFQENKFSELTLPNAVESFGSAVFASCGRYVVIRTKSPAVTNDVIKGEFGSVVNPDVVWVKGLDEKTGKVILSTKSIAFNPFIEANLDQMPLVGNTITFSDIKVHDYKLKPDTSLVLTPEFLESNSQDNPYDLYYVTSVGDPKIVGNDALYFKVNNTIDKAALLKGITAYDNQGEDLEVKVSPEQIDSSVPGTHSVTLSATDSNDRTTTVYRDVIVTLNPEDLETGKGWIMSDFTYIGNRVDGFSPQGEIKAMTNHTVVFPEFNPYPDPVNGELLPIHKVENFSGRNIKSIVLPPNLKEIGYDAFSGNQLSAVDIPDTVTTIGGSAFKDNRLLKVNLPEGLSTLDSYAFQNNRISKIEIPSTLKEIPEYAFDTNALEELIIPETLTSIGNDAFSNNNLTYVRIPQSITALGNSAFQKNEISGFDWDTPLTTIPNGLFKNNKFSEVVIPSEVTKIGDSAFAKMSDLGEDSKDSERITSITLNNKVEVIGPNAFLGHALQMDELAFPDTLKEIGGRAFYKGNTDYDLSVFIKSVHLPDSVETVGSHAFKYNNISKLRMSQGVKNIQDSAFENNQIEEVELPDTLTELGASSFSFNKLKEIAIPEGIESINNYTFENNELTKVTLPSTLRSIGEVAFGNNKTLEDIVLPDGLETIKRAAFRYCNLQSVDIPDSVTSIEESAFKGNGLLHVKLPNQLKKIADGTFYDNRLTEIDIPDTVTVIESQAFNKNLLTELHIPQNVEDIQSRAFDENKLARITCDPDGKLSKIGNNAFRNNQLVEVDLPHTVTSIKPDAFTSNPGWDPSPEPDAFDTQDGTGTQGVYAFAENRVKVNIAREGTPFTPAGLEFKPENKHVVNPTLLVVKHVLESNPAFEIAPANYVLCERGETKVVNPLVSKYYQAVDGNPRNVSIDSEKQELTIVYRAVPIYDTQFLHIDLKHLEPTSTIVSSGARLSEGLKDAHGEQYFMISISCEDAASDSFRLENPWVYVKLDEPVGKRLSKVRFIDEGLGLASEWKYENGYLKIHLNRTVEARSHIDLAIALTFADGLPYGAVVDLTNNASLYDQGTLVKSSANKVAIRSTYRPWMRVRGFDSNTERVKAEDRGNGNKYATVDSNPTVLDENIVVEVPTTSVGDLKIEVDIPTYIGLDENGVERDNLKAKFDPAKSNGWLLDPSGTKVVKTVSMKDNSSHNEGHRFIYSDFLPVFTYPRVKLNKASITEVRAQILDSHEDGLYAGSEDVAQGKFNADDPYDTLVPGHFKKSEWRIYFTDAENIVPEDAVSVLRSGYTNPSQIGMTKRIDRFADEPENKNVYVPLDHMDSFAKKYLTGGNSYNLENELSHFGLHDGFFDIKENRQKESPWSFYCIPEVANATYGYIDRIEDFTVIANELDERMIWSGLNLPKSYHKAQVEAYESADATGTPIFEKVGYVGRMTFPEAIAPRVKSIKVKFSPEDQVHPNQTGVQKLVFYSQLKDPDKKQYTQDPSHIGAGANTYSSKVSYSGNAILANNDTEKAFAISDSITDRICVIPADEGIMSLDVKQKTNTRISLNTDIDYGVTVSGVKPKESSVKDFLVVDILPPSVNAKDVELTDDFKASSVNPSFEIKDNIDGKGSWGVVIKADSFNPTKHVDSVSPFETAQMPIATIHAKTSRHIGTGVYPNRAWMAFNNVDAHEVDAAEIANKQEDITIDHKHESILPTSKATELLSAYPDDMITSSGDSFSLVNSSEFTTFLSVKRGTDADSPWNESYVYASSQEDFVYRMNLVRNRNVLPPALDVIQVLPYNGDLRLQVNNDGERNPRKTDVTGLLPDGSTYESRVELTGPVVCENPELVNLFEYRYTTADPATIKDVEPNQLRDLVWVDAAGLPQKDGAPDWSKVTAVRVTCKNTEKAYKDNIALHFDVPMRQPDNIEYALDDTRAVTSFVRWISDRPDEEAFESNSVWTVMESESVNLKIHKLSVDPYAIDPKTGEKKETPLSGVSFKLWQVYNELTDKGRAHKTFTMFDGTNIEVLSEPLYTSPRSYDVVVDTMRNQGVVTDSRGNALYNKVKVRNDYILEEKVPEGYKTTAESTQYISGADLKASLAAGTYEKTVKNFKIIKMTPIIPQKLSLSFNKVGVAGKPIPFVDFKLSATSSTGFEWSKEASSSSRSGLVSFTEVPVFGELPAANGVGKPYVLTEVQPRGMLKPIDPIEIRFAKNLDADGTWLAKSDVERNEFGDIIKVNAFGYEDQVGNSYSLGTIPNRRIDLPVYVIGLTKPSDIAKNYEDLSFSNGFKVKGVKVALADNQEMDQNYRELTSDIDGRVVFENIKAGKDYYIKQVDQVLEDFTAYPHVVKIRIDEHGVLYVNDKLSSNDYGLLPNVYSGTNALEIHKTSQKNGEGESLQGATFELWEIQKDADGNITYVSDAPEQVKTTDDQGRLTFKGFAVVENADGTRLYHGKSYLVKEVTPPVGHTVVDKPFEFTTVANEVFYQQINVANPLITLEVHKVDFVTREPIEGAEFGLYENADGSGTPVEKAVSDEQGIVRFKWNTFTNTKEYSVRETKVPEGYNAEDAKTHVVPVHLPDFENRTGWNGTMVVNATNIPLPARLTVTKRDALSYKALPGVQFDLYVVKDGVEEKVDGPLTTNEYGKLTFDNLEDGDYIIREVEAPEHFVLAKDKHISVHGSKLYTTTIDNYRKPVDFKLHNIARLEDKKAGKAVTFDLKDTKFTIQKLFSGVPVGPQMTLTTAEDGILDLQGLTIGAEYMLIQNTDQSSPLPIKGYQGGYGHGAWTIKLEDQGIGVPPRMSFKEYDAKFLKTPSTEFEVNNEKSEILVTNNADLPKINLTIAKEFVGGENLDDTSFKVVVHGAEQEAEKLSAELENQGVPEDTAVPNVEDKVAAVVNENSADQPKLAGEETVSPVVSVDAVVQPSPAAEEVVKKPVFLGEGFLVKGADKAHAKLVLADLPGFYLNETTKQYEPYILSFEEVINPMTAGEKKIEFDGSFEAKFEEVQIGSVLENFNVMGNLSLTNTYTAGKINLDMNLGWEGKNLPEIKPNTWFVLDRRLPGSDATEELAFQKFEDGDDYFDFGAFDVTDYHGTPYIYSIRQTNESKKNATPELYSEKATKDVRWIPVQYGEQTHTFSVVNVYAAEETVTPEVPTEPETPVVPKVPTQPEVPVVPAVPTEPHQPIEPPVEPAVPTDPPVPPTTDEPKAPEVESAEKPKQKKIEVPRTYDTSLSVLTLAAVVLLGIGATICGSKWQKKNEK